VPEELQQALRRNANPEGFDKLPPALVFFEVRASSDRSIAAIRARTTLAVDRTHCPRPRPSSPRPSASQGARYVFTHNIAPGAGAVRNAACVGRFVDLHPDEPDDDLSQPFRLLRHAPAAVWVQPCESPAPIGTVAGSVGPPDCIPMLLESASSNRPIQLPENDRPEIGGVVIASYSCKRHGFQLGDGYCVTDYYAQGLSFRGDAWLAHLCVPERGALQRASVLVTLTRFADWDRVLAWTPLWQPTATSDDIRAVVDAFHRASRPSPDLLAEVRRLNDLAQRTRATYPAHLQRLVDELFPPDA
jgi:hypothetical protein